MYRFRAKSKPILRANGAGFLAILLWSTTVALARSLSEDLGPITAAAAVYGVGSAAAAVNLIRQGVLVRLIRELPSRYLLGCGALFVGYMVALFLGVGRADGRVQVLEVGLLNYMWPVLTLLLSVALLRKRAKAVLLLPATALALAGIFFVLTHEVEVTLASFLRNLASNPVAYGLGLAAAVLWALYSTLTRLWAGGHARGGVDLFIPVTFMVLVAGAVFVDEPREWSWPAVAEATFLGLATYAAYGLWDVAMREGRIVLVAAGSYLTPLLSTLVSVVYLAVTPGQRLWWGCGLLIVGSVLSALAVDERAR
jgi:drug/metabolite transporter (DMT)-like permease